jgi:hypothetical protein
VTHEFAVAKPVYHVAQPSISEFGLPTKRGQAEFFDGRCSSQAGGLAVQNSKHLLSTAIAFGAMMSVGAASAADMGALPYAKAWPTRQVDPIVSWAGFYAGLNGGGLWAHSAITDVNSYAAPAIAGTVTSVSTRGFLAGGQLGYTWQASCFILGIEADLGYMDSGGNKLLTGTGSGTRVGLKSGAYGDVTGRIGVTYDRALFYAKGGYAVLEDASSFSTVTGSFSGVQSTAPIPDTPSAQESSIR